MLGQLSPYGSRVFPPGDMQVKIAVVGSGIVEATSGVTGVTGAAGATPSSELGEGLIVGAADFVGSALGC